MEIKLSKETAKEIYDKIIEDFNIVDFTSTEKVYEPVIIGAIMRGMIEYDSEKKILIQNLVSHIESGDLSGDKAIAKFEYSHKIKAFERRTLAKESNQMDVAIHAISILTKQPDKIIGKLDSADWQVAHEVAALFL